MEADYLLERYDNSAENSSRVAQYIRLLLTELRPEESNENLPNDDDGPILPVSFRWKGKTYDGLSLISGRFLTALWSAKYWICEINDLGESVWEDRAVEPDKDMVGAARTAANAFFKKHSLPFQVGRKGEHVFLKDLSEVNCH